MHTFQDWKITSIQKEYLRTIVSTLRSENTKELIKTLRNKRITKERADQNNLIQIDPSIYQEISTIDAKSVGLNDVVLNKNCIAHKGKVPFLLKKSSALKRNIKRIKEI